MGSIQERDIARRYILQEDTVSFENAQDGLNVRPARAELFLLFGSPISKHFLREIRGMVLTADCTDETLVSVWLPTAYTIRIPNPSSSAMFSPYRRAYFRALPESSSFRVMSAADIKNGYSADVRMQLTISGNVLTIGQLGPDFIILRDPPTTLRLRPRSPCGSMAAKDAGTSTSPMVSRPVRRRPESLCANSLTANQINPSSRGGLPVRSGRITEPGLPGGPDVVAICDCLGRADSAGNLDQEVFWEMITVMLQ